MSRDPLWLSLLPAGDSALLMDFGAVSPVVNDRLLAVADAIHAIRIPGILGVVPGFATLLIEYDARLVDGEALAVQLGEIELEASVPRRRGRKFLVPVCYGDVYGPDLAATAEAVNLSQQEVIRMHTAQPYRIYCLGFAPGFPLAGLLPKALHLARRSSPRAQVAAGSVAIAGSQTGIYPLATPGGWHLIGQTSVLLCDWTRPEPIPYRPGDYLQFESVTPRELEDYRGRTPEVIDA